MLPCAYAEGCSVVKPDKIERVPERRSNNAIIAPVVLRIDDGEFVVCKALTVVQKREGVEGA